ncbi:MAG: chromosomal replication initiator protein DnaA, partial [Planctomycetes bacterium]|nr:chromosomal replication initiator protein DnaA [Planctomycetota bacterium]
EDHTLDRFVVGPSNHVAYSAALETLRPGGTYNPLFVFGGSGMGKTHLLQAITRELFCRGERSIRYVTCEDFVNRFVRSLRARSVDRFRSQFHELAVFVIDDIQIIGGKTQTQLELLQAIDAVVHRGGQVILASDVRPHEIPKLNAQLLGRFVGGLVCSIEAPDYPTRLRILEQESRSRSASVPLGIFHRLADGHYRNVRELIGALVRVLAASSLLGEPLTEALAERVLGDRRSELPSLSPESLCGLVAERNGLTVTDLKSRSRAKSVSAARQELVYLARVLTDVSLAELGRFLGGRNHATMNFAFRRALERLQGDDGYRSEIDGLLARLGGRA